MLMIFQRVRGDVAVMLRTLAGNRGLGILCFLSVFFLLLSTKSGYIIWRCPLNHTLHLPCPGCGLTSAALALCRGEFWEALRLHPFAPYFLLLGLSCSPGILLNRTCRLRWAALLEGFERRTAANTAILLLFISYSIIRFIWAVFRGIV